MKIDWHIHSIVSDGVLTPAEIFAIARRIGLQQISITDHDAIGAYRNFAGDCFANAAAEGISLISGIELDSDFHGAEIHILGYDFNLKHPRLVQHLDTTKALRKQKTCEQIQAINAFFKRAVIDEAEVVVPFRDTLMKPHLIHALLRQKLFTSYREAADWMSETIRVEAKVPKIDAAVVIAMIHDAGGKAVLAHPGYYKYEKTIDLTVMVHELMEVGLGGIEVEYPYYKTSSAFPTRESEAQIIEELRRMADRFNLMTTRGSDAHAEDQLIAFNR